MRSTSTLNTLLSKTEDGISRGLPVNTELLHMNDSISLDNLVYKCTNLTLVHGPDFFKAILVTLLESLEFVLQLLKLFGEFLIIVSELDIVSLEVL